MTDPICTSCLVRTSIETHPDAPTSVTLDQPRLHVAVQGVPRHTCPRCGSSSPVEGATEVARDLALAVGRALRRSTSGTAPAQRMLTPDQVELVTIRLGIPLTDRPELTEDVLRMVPVGELKASLDDLLLDDAVREGLQSWLEIQRNPGRMIELLGASFADVVGRRPLVLWGPQGVGKSLLARAAAAALGRPLAELRCGAMASRWVGETEDRLSAAFAEVRRSGALLFVDEADSLISARLSVSTANDAAHNQLRNHLIQELNSHHGPIVLASNLRDGFDDALVSRMDEVAVPAPGPELRQALLARLLDQVEAPVRPDPDADWIAMLDARIVERGFGSAPAPFTQRDLRERVVARAALPALRRGGATIHRPDVEQALDQTLNEMEAARQQSDLLSSESLAPVFTFIREAERFDESQISDALAIRPRRRTGNSKGAQLEESEEDNARLRAVLEDLQRRLAERGRGLDRAGLTRQPNRDTLSAWREWVRSAGGAAEAR